MTNKQKGILCILISAFSFALMNLFVQLAGDINPIQKSFFRNLIAFLFAAAILFKEHDFSIPLPIGALEVCRYHRRQG